MAKTMVKGKQAAAVSASANINPDELMQAGLPDDFEGSIAEIDYCAWDFGGNADQYGCTMAVRIVIRPDDDSGIAYDAEIGGLESFLTASDLRNWVPSEDNTTPAGGFDVDTYASIQGKWQPDGTVLVEATPEADDLARMRGRYAVAGVQILEKLERNPSAKVNLPNSSNYAFFLTTLKEAGYTAWADGLDGMVGLHGHWNRLAPPSRGGAIKSASGEKKAAKDVLVLTEFTEGPAGSAKAGAKATSKPAAAAAASAKTAAARTTAADKAKAAEAEAEAEEGEEPEGEEDEYRVEVGAAVLEILMDSDGEMPRAKVFSKVASKMGVKESYPVLNDDAFWTSSDLWNYDPETKTVSIGG